MPLRGDRGGLSFINFDGFRRSFREENEVNDDDNDDLDSMSTDEENDMVTEMPRRITVRRASRPRLSQIRATFMFETDISHRREILNHLQTSYLFSSLDKKTIANLAKEFEIVQYNVGDVIIRQGDREDKMYYYFLLQGQCGVFKELKDTKLKLRESMTVRLPETYGTIAEGSGFGENSVLFGERAATVIASQGSFDYEKYIPKSQDDDQPKVTLYRLDGAKIREEMTKDELETLQNKMIDVFRVFDSLSGIDLKIAEKGTIIRPYEPSGFWLMRQYRGTILMYVLKDVIIMMMITAAFGLLFHSKPSYYEPLIKPLAEWWNTLNPFTIFVTTFFLKESFDHWKSFYWNARGIQGRLNDISLLMASTASRDENNCITEPARKSIRDVARISRLFHQLFWSMNVVKLNPLHSKEGLSYLRSLDQITPEEYKLLQDTKSLGVHNTALTWLTARVWLALEKGHIRADPCDISTKITDLRRLMTHVPQMYAGRMPIAYAHFVFLLMATYLMISTIALYSLFAFWAIPAVGLLTLFHKGIFILSMMFLDPVDNDSSHRGVSESAGFDVGVLVRESNMSSICFEGCADALPGSYFD